MAVDMFINTIKDVLLATFMSLRIMVYPAILGHVHQYYKGCVACDLYVTQNYGVPSNPRHNPRHRSTLPIQNLMGGPPAGAL
jgi:hypothetical protein